MKITHICYTGQATPFTGPDFTPWVTIYRGTGSPRCLRGYRPTPASVRRLCRAVNNQHGRIIVFAYGFTYTA